MERTMFVSKQLNLRFAAVMMGFVGVVFLTYREDVLGPLLAPLTILTAQTTLALLHMIGMEAARVATVIYHPDGFAYEVYYRCTGFLPVAFLTVSILSYPGVLRPKVVGLAVGMPVLVALNFTRLIHLFYIGVYNPAIYDLVHKVLWEGFIILAVFGLWLGWRQWSEPGNWSTVLSAQQRPSLSVHAPQMPQTGLRFSSVEVLDERTS